MNEDKKNRITSLCATIGVHVLLFVVFFLALAWSAPDPPIPEYGIEFSMSSAASGGAEETDPQEEVEPMEETLTEETQEELTEMASEPDVNENEEAAKTEDINSPDVVEQKSVEKPVVKPLVKPEKEKATSTETSKLVEKKAEPVKADPKVDERSLYKGGEGAATKPSGQGASLDMSGWMWDEKPNPNDLSAENGKIIFEIAVDEEGIVTKVETLEKSVSPSLEKIYMDAVRELTFSRSAGNRSTAQETTGKITFIIKSK